MLTFFNTFTLKVLLHMSQTIEHSNCEFIVILQFCVFQSKSFSEEKRHNDQVPNLLHPSSHLRYRHQRHHH